MTGSYQGPAHGFSDQEDMDPLSRSTGEDVGAAFLDGLLQAEGTSRHLSPTVIERACGHRQCDWVFRDTTVITPNLMNIA